VEISNAFGTESVAVALTRGDRLVLSFENAELLERAEIRVDRCTFELEHRCELASCHRRAALQGTDDRDPHRQPKGVDGVGDLLGERNVEAARHAPMMTHDEADKTVFPVSVPNGSVLHMMFRLVTLGQRLFVGVHLLAVLGLLLGAIRGDQSQVAAFVIVTVAFVPHAIFWRRLRARIYVRNDIRNARYRLERDRIAGQLNDLDYRGIAPDAPRR